MEENSKTARLSFPNAIDTETAWRKYILKDIPGFIWQVIQYMFDKSYFLLYITFTWQERNFWLVMARIGKYDTIYWRQLVSVFICGEILFCLNTFLTSIVTHFFNVMFDTLVYRTAYCS